MTIAQVLAKVDRQKPNKVAEADKIGWLSDCDMTIFKTIIQTHEYYVDGVLTDPPAFTGYADNVDQTTELYAPPPYDKLYTYALFLQIDLVNMELGKYNNDMALFNAAMDEYAAYYNRTNMPLQPATYIKL